VLKILIYATYSFYSKFALTSTFGSFFRCAGHFIYTNNADDILNY